MFDSFSKQKTAAQPASFQSLEDNGQQRPVQKDIGILMEVPLQVTVELGRTEKTIREILQLGQGSIIELDKLIGENVDVLVNGKKIATAEVVIIDDKFAIRVTSIVTPSKRL